MTPHEPIQSMRPWEAREADRRPDDEPKNHMEGSRAWPPEVLALREARLQERIAAYGELCRSPGEARADRMALLKKKAQTMIECACGQCGQMIRRWDLLGREHRFAVGHNRKPRQENA